MKKNLLRYIVEFVYHIFNSLSSTKHHILHSCKIFKEITVSYMVQSFIICLSFLRCSHLVSRPYIMYVAIIVISSALIVSLNKHIMTNRKTILWYACLSSPILKTIHAHLLFLDSFMYIHVWIPYLLWNLYLQVILPQIPRKYFSYEFVRDNIKSTFKSSKWGSFLT